MNKYVLFINNAVVRCKIASNKLSNNLLRTRKGFGMNELLGIAAAIVIAAFIVIPGLQGIAEKIMTRLSTWWSAIEGDVFLTK